MHCKAAGKAIFENSLGVLPGTVRIELEEHCRSCNACRQEYIASAALDGRFIILRHQPVPAVDIREAVLEQIRTAPPLPGRGFAWALVAAVASSAAFIALTLVLLPHAVPLLQAALHGGAALIRSTSPMLSLGSALVQIGSLPARPLLSIGAAFGAVEPMAWNILITGAGASVAASLVIVSRAFLRAEPAVSPKES